MPRNYYSSVGSSSVLLNMAEMVGKLKQAKLVEINVRDCKRILFKFSSAIISNSLYDRVVQLFWYI